jgi:hypothetical protein
MKIQTLQNKFMQLSPFKKKILISSLLLQSTILKMQSTPSRQAPRKFVSVVDLRDIGWMTYMREMDDVTFVRRHRVSKNVFEMFVNRIVSKRGRNRNQYVERHLSLCLRSCAGSRMVDLSELYGLSESTGYKKFWEMILWIIDVGDVVDFKEDDDGDLEERAQAFRNISNAGIMQGCVAAIDGLLVEIERPNVNDPMKFFSTRYKKFGVNMQAACDAQKRFVFVSMICGAATNDAKAFEFSSLAEVLHHEMDSRFWVAGDCAYQSNLGIVTPFTASQMDDDNNQFNFHLSQVRIVIENAFGILKGRWGILWRRLRFPVEKVSRIVQALVILHNAIVDERVDDRGPRDLVVETRLVTRDVPIPEDLRGEEEEVNTDGHVPVYPLPADKNDTRVALCAAVKAAGLRRPRNRGNVTRARAAVLGSRQA